MTPKNPVRPPAPLIREPRDVIAFDLPLWRIHRVGGDHPLAWDALRHYGPVADMRWDPHPLPAQRHVDIGVTYAAADAATALAEVFQSRRAITRSAGHALAGWRPTRALQLLDLTADWPLRNGASASLHAARKSTCRAWVRSVHATWPDLDGLHVPSTMTGRPVTVLFATAATSFPPAPALWRLLNDPAIDPILVPAARELTWPIRRM